MQNLFIIKRYENESTDSIQESKKDIYNINLNEFKRLEQSGIAVNVLCLPVDCEIFLSDNENSSNFDDISE